MAATQMRQSVASDTAGSLGLQFLLTVLAFVASVIVSRALGPTGRGQYYLPLIAAATIVNFSKLGLEQANVYLVASRHHEIPRLSGQNALVGVVAGGSGLLLMVGLRYLLPSIFAGTASSLLLLSGVTIPFSLHTQLSAGLLTLRGDVTGPFYARVLGSTLHVAALATLFLFKWPSVADVLAIYLAAVVATWWFTVCRFPGTQWFRPRWDVPLLRESLPQSLVVHIGMMLFMLQLRIDTFFLQAIVGAKAVGQYSLSVALAETALLATDSLALAILPRQFRIPLPKRPLSR